MAAILVGVRKEVPRRLVRLQSATESMWAWSGWVGVVTGVWGMSVVESQTPTCSEGRKSCIT